MSKLMQQKHHYCGPGPSEELSGPYIRHTCTFDPYFLGYLNINVRYTNCSITYTANCNHLDKFQLIELKECLSCLSANQLFEYAECYATTHYYDDYDVVYELFSLLVENGLNNKIKFYKNKSDLPGDNNNNE